jgi:hypothetical protein
MLYDLWPDRALPGLPSSASTLLAEHGDFARPIDERNDGAILGAIVGFVSIPTIAHQADPFSQSKVPGHPGCEIPAFAVRTTTVFSPSRDHPRKSVVELGCPIV